MNTTLKKIKSLCKAYEAIGRAAYIYPRAKQVQLNGRARISFGEAAKIIQASLAAQWNEPS